MSGPTKERRMRNAWYRENWAITPAQLRRLGGAEALDRMTDLGREIMRLTLKSTPPAGRSRVRMKELGRERKMRKCLDRERWARETAPRQRKQAVRRAASPKKAPCMELSLHALETKRIERMMKLAGCA